MYIYIYIYTCIITYVCVYIYIERERYRPAGGLALAGRLRRRAVLAQLAVGNESAHCLKANHPERPTITLGRSLEHARGILENDVVLFDLDGQPIRVASQ